MFIASIIKFCPFEQNKNLSNIIIIDYYIQIIIILKNVQLLNFLHWGERARVSYGKKKNGIVGANCDVYLYDVARRVSLDVVARSAHRSRCSDTRHHVDTGQRHPNRINSRAMRGRNISPVQSLIAAFDTATNTASARHRCMYHRRSAYDFRSVDD